MNESYEDRLSAARAALGQAREQEAAANKAKGSAAEAVCAILMERAPVKVGDVVEIKGGGIFRVAKLFVRFGVYAGDPTFQATGHKRLKSGAYGAATHTLDLRGAKVIQP